MRWLLLFILALVLSGCHQWKIPRHSFGERIPAAPHYDQQDHWACLPDRKDACDTVPIASLSDGQADAAIDVFFVYPTLFKDRSAWNASLDDSDLRESLGQTALRHQASLFNGVAKVYVPYYRQMTYYGFWGNDSDKGQALQLARADIEAAFSYYMEHFNHGRPFILAGHSQGAWSIYQLVESLLPYHPEWQSQLVAVYAVGWAIPPDSLTKLPVCSTATQTGCLVTWNTYAWGHLPAGPYSTMPENPICVNPLNWKTDTTYAPFDLNKGGVGRHYRKVYPQAADAKVEQGYLWIHKDHLPGSTKWIKRFHAADYNLFWLNVRQNVEDRAHQWLITPE